MGNSTITETQALPFHLTAEDRVVMLQTDDAYTLMNWGYIKAAIASGDLAKLTRTPSQLRAYQEWSSNAKAEYGSVTNFLLTQRLHWMPQSSSKTGECSFAVVCSTPLSNPADFLVLRNDWPYGLEPGISHLVIWTKHRLPVDWDADGILTPEGHRLVADFVRGLERKLGVEGEDKVVWFKNYGATSSVRTIDHVHVLLRGVEESELVKVLSN